MFDSIGGMHAIQNPNQKKFSIRENESFYVRIPEYKGNKLSSHLFNSQPIPMQLGNSNELPSQNFSFPKQQPNVDFEPLDQNSLKFQIMNLSKQQTDTQNMLQQVFSQQQQLLSALMPIIQDCKMRNLN